ncbi:hypothetical protein KUCAC02_001428, partial [Chaenocephalus aceratus]
APPLGCDLCKLPGPPLMSMQDGGKGKKREKREKRGGREDAGENSCTFNYDQE